MTTTLQARILERLDDEIYMNVRYAKEIINEEFARGDVKHQANVAVVEDRIAKLEEAVTVMREATAFYANPSDYVVPFTGGKGKLYFDCGIKAKEALTRVDELLGDKE